MLNISEDDLKAAIVQKAADEILKYDDDLSAMIGKEVKSRIDKIFAASAEAQIQSMIADAVKESFNHEYQRVTQWGEANGPKTTIRAELEKTVSGYWTAKVDAKTGKPSTSDYSSVTRAEYLMTQVCAEDFMKGMKDAVINVTGALKDGLRNQLAHHMDTLLSELFRVKSLQDQGKVEKPY
jgi:hypothetical protein